MNTHASASLPHREHRGFGLIEIMVGVVIGLIAVLVIFQVYAVAEGFKRNTTAAGEAQQNGLFSTFMLGLELGNGGAAMATAAKDLASCVDTGNIATTFRPIPVLITDGGGNASPDSFVVTYSMATTLTSTAMFNGPIPFLNPTGNPLAPVTPGGTYQPGDPYQIQSPGGFHVGDLIVGIATPGAPNSLCASSKVLAVSPPGSIAVDINGDPTSVSNVTITHTGTAISFTGDGRPGLSTLFNMGPADRAQKIRYSVNNGVLYSTPLLDSNGAPAALAGNPLASNIVNMKVEYGIDSNLDPKRLLDTWVQASAAGWDPATLLAAPITTINQIKAVRIGIIVQSEQFDKNLAGFTGGDYVNGDYNWVLFDCADANKANCPGRLTGSVPATVSPAGNWRFRKYETVIPLRNEIWNKQ
ncbi:MAG TPA: PilW family protein [Casimicrobiaceae bacterium]|nr:PilW family protein [Casimicrobiaceae bacterium]